VILTARDDYGGYGKERWISIGWIKVLIGVLVFIELRGDVIRIISP
jgi:uncharacterized DUF497 family protein